MIAFLIEIVKALVTFFAVCVGLGILYLVFVVVREVGWEVRRQNRRSTNRRTKRNESRIFQGGVSVRDWGHGSNQGIKGRRSKRSTLSAARLHGDYNGSSCTA